MRAASHALDRHRNSALSMSAPLWNTPSLYTLTKLTPAKEPNGKDASGPPTSSVPRSTAKKPDFSISERTVSFARLAGANFVIEPVDALLKEPQTPLAHRSTRELQALRDRAD